MVCKVKLVLSFTIHVLQTKNVCTKLQNSTQKQKKETKPKSIYNSLCSWSMLSLSFRFILYITANTSNIISGHLSCATNTHPSSPKTSLSGCNIRTVFCIFIPPAESTVFFVFFPSVDTFPKTWGPTDRTDRWTKYTLQTDIQIPDSQSKIPTKLSTQCALHSILMYSLLCSRLLSSVLCVFSFSLSLSFLVYSKKRSWITPAVQIFQ